MVENATEPKADTVEAVPQAGDLLGFGPEMVRAVAAALDAGDDAATDALIAKLHYADLADLVEQLSADRRARLIERIRPRFDPEILPELDDSVRDEVVAQLGAGTVARAITRIDSDDALYVLDRLDEPLQRQVLQAIPEALRSVVEEHLAFPEDSAGRLMQRDFVAVPMFWTVGQTIDFMRESEGLPQDFYDIFVVDPRHRPVGTVALSRVLRTKRPVHMSEIMETHVITVPAAMDQEEVAYVFRQQDLVSAPVVDDSGRLIGVITIDDVVDVIDEEAEEDLMRLGGVREDDLNAPVVETGTRRFPWLFVNLGTAILASAVISLFEPVIAQIVVLAVLMPIVASMGGNAGTQTLTVAVRALAMKELTPANARRVIRKEMAVGLFNGLLFAAVVGVVAWLWSHDPHIGLVMGAAMVVNLVAAGLAGASIPLGLAALGIDPAIASGVFLTTVTDVVGFFAFLGFATWFLL
jgi:magnesium transporter